MSLPKIPEREHEQGSGNWDVRSPGPRFDDMVLVGRIARSHGLKGYVVVSPDTDFADERFATGSVVWTRFAAGEERLTIASARFHGNRAVIKFHGFDRVEDAERLVGHELRVPEDALRPLAPGMFYQYQLVGCEVVSGSGHSIGGVVRVEGGTGNSRLVVKGERGEVQIPFAMDICREIDVLARRIVVEPPEGLLELNEADGRQRAAGRHTKSRRRP